MQILNERSLFSVMNISKKIRLYRFTALLLCLLIAPMALYEFQRGDLLEMLQSLGYLVAGLVYAIEPRAFVGQPDNPRARLVEISVAQKSLALLAFMLILLPFVTWYISGFMEIM